jgi:DNA modification methylase
VDLIVTSPPYYGLRSYTDGGEHYDGQIGSEATPAEYVAALVACTREWVRVLKPSGSLFVNLGDKYATSPAGNGQPSGKHTGNAGAVAQMASSPRRDFSAPHKSLLGLPWRYALAATDQLGLILRAEIIWAKPNGLPESVTDRVRRAHEQVFHFTRQPRYYSAVDEIREAYLAPNATRTFGHVDPSRGDHGKPFARMDARDVMNPLGKLPGSVWSIPSAPLVVPAHLGVDHFAAFPPALVRPIVLGWSPPGVCTACGQGRRPVTDLQYLTTGDKFAGGTPMAGRHRSGSYMGRGSLATITGYTCGCPEPDAPTRPAVVLDPFGGTGTTALVAAVHGRHGITVDLSADYCRLAAWRCHDPGERARALDVPRPPVVPDDQVALFDV